MTNKRLTKGKNKTGPIPGGEIPGRRLFKIQNPNIRI